jgi:hypothetical protein
MSVTLSGGPFPGGRSTCWKPASIRGFEVSLRKLFRNGLSKDFKEVRTRIVEQVVRNALLAGDNQFKTVPIGV